MAASAVGGIFLGRTGRAYYSKARPLETAACHSPQGIEGKEEKEYISPSSWSYRYGAEETEMRTSGMGAQNTV
jgi:hypothetical protein